MSASARRAAPARASRPRRLRSATPAQWRRRALVAAILGAGIAVAVSQIDFQRAIQELTLPLQHEDIIRQQAAEKDLDPALIAAVIYSESKFRDQESAAGAIGLMQITPSTAKYIERLSGGTTFKISDLNDPQINISYGSYLLRRFLDRYGGNTVAALAAYNAGPGNVDSWGGSGLQISDIGFPETRAYVEEVLSKRDEYASKYSSELGL
jgi:soluble lytic murein transglycosylase